MTPNLLILSHATYVGASGATAAATYSFFTKEYKPPVQNRAIEADVVINQNGRFKHIYDNGPGFYNWNPFSIVCENKLTPILGATAGGQYARLREMWEHPGRLGMQTPTGDVYSVNWSGNNLERNFRVFPRESGQVIEYEVVVQFEEAG